MKETCIVNSSPTDLLREVTSVEQSTQCEKTWKEHGGQQAPEPGGAFCRP